MAMNANDSAGRRKSLMALSTCLLAAVTSFGQPPQAPSTAPPHSAASDPLPQRERNLPRGKKLILKDGTFQLVGEYQVEGDRVRYYSVDTSQWEEMPANLVDWDKTNRIAAEEAQRDAAAVAKVKSQELARQGDTLDIDASVEAAPGVFLPPGEGLFAFDGKTVMKLAQAPIDTKLSKKNAVERVFVPIPIIPTQHNISIHRPHAEFRVSNRQPEFYMRLAAGPEPELELIRARTHGDSREIEKLDELFGQHQFKRASLPMQRWVVAPGLYRFTLGAPLEPGEYVLAEAVEDNGLDLYVWDFGVESGTGSAASEKK
jgi:hypothetical protein